jgi:hypothetical protein
MRAVFDNIAVKQFNDMQRNRPYYDALILNTPSGKETQLYKVGDECVTNEKSSLIKNIKVRIEEAYEENGYWKYIVSHGKGNKFRCMQRQIDLGRI